MKHCIGFSSIAALTAALLAGCNSARAPQAVATADLASATRSSGGPHLPEGSGCANAISRYRAVTDNDLEMGHVNRGVYDRIQTEINEAAAACSKGQDAHAVALVRASKSRHGYPG
jgi:hypothetical protein